MRIPFLLFILITCFASSALAQESVATIKETAGEVVVLRAEVEMPAEVGLRLQAEDVVRTGSDGAAGFTFLDGTRIGLGPSSEMQLADYVFKPQEKEYAFDMYMKDGSAVYSSGKLGALSPESVTIRTPQATVGVRGTKFCIRVQ